MPTYEYVCRSCGEHVEVVQSFTDDPLETCPSCAGSLRKVFGNVGIVFKGSGFYKTDSREPAKAKAGNGNGKSDTSSTGMLESSTSALKLASVTVRGSAMWVSWCRLGAPAA